MGGLEIKGNNMYIEFIAKTANRRLTARKKRLVIILICFIIAMLAMISYNAHLALSLLIPIAFVCYQLKSVFSSRNSIRDVRMRFDLNDDPLIWTKDDGDDVTQKEIYYGNADLQIDNDGRCEFSYIDTKNRAGKEVFYGPKTELEKLQSILKQGVK